MLDKLNFFLNSNIFKILKQSDNGKMLCHRYLSKMLNHQDISFVNDDGSISHDPMGYFDAIPDYDKDEILKIIQGNNHNMHTNNKYIVKKTGSGVVMKIPGVTYLVYADTFVPFDSSF